MTIYGTYDACAAQVGQRPYFDAAFAFLRQMRDGTHEAAGRLAALAEGEAARIDLAGPDGADLYALMQYARTRPRAEQKAESHRTYADVQAVIDGDEILEVMPLDGLETTLPYDASRDVALYTMPKDGSRLILRPGLCAVLFPEDGHAPLQAPDGIARPSRRVVVKVRLEA
jgi:YhcH/YjgK/YiaL family protein